MQKPAEHSLASPPDARVAFLGLLAYSCALFFVDTWWGMAAFALAAAGVVVAWKVPLRRVLACLVPLAFILVCTVIAQIPRGIEAGLFYAARIALLAVATCVVAFSYDNTQFVRAFSRLLSPLRAMHVPVDDIATTFSIALRCIPGCLEELERVAAAQRSRASRLDEGSAFARATAWGRVFVPMLVGLFRHAGSLAQAMEARCYGALQNRSSLHGKQPLQCVDWVLLAAICVFCIVGAALL